MAIGLAAPGAGRRRAAEDPLLARARARTGVPFAEPGPTPYSRKAKGLNEGRELA